ncbi:MAG TPA: DNA-binding protein [Candidatus Nanoarchaeia archaeon]|nr:DNA-binding protein [Candidatus Nanoarchaeia archaeon]
MDMDELRQRKMEELREQLQSQQENAQLQQQISQLESMVRQKMSKEAISRMSNIRAAFPEKYVQVLALLGQMLQQGQLTHVDDAALKGILQHLSAKKQFTIRR